MCDHNEGGEGLSLTGFKKAKKRGLGRLAWLRRILISMKRIYLNRLWGMHIDPTAEFSLSAKFDRNFATGIYVGAYSYVALEARILTHDRTRGLYVPTRIGRNCFIGARSLIMPGVEIGDNCIVGAGSVVVKSVPPRSVVAGKPAEVVRANIDVGPDGRLPTAGATERRLAEEGLA